MSNLPPGVSEGMIPGNRPEDEAEEAFWNAVYERAQAAGIDADLIESPGVEQLILVIRDLAYERGRADEKSDTEIAAAMTAPELGLSVRDVHRLLGRGD